MEVKKLKGGGVFRRNFWLLNPMSKFVCFVYMYVQINNTKSLTCTDNGSINTASFHFLKRALRDRSLIPQTGSFDSSQVMCLSEI